LFGIQPLAVSCKTSGIAELSISLTGYNRLSALVRSRVESNGATRAGSKAARSKLRAAPSKINSLTASPVAGALRIPQTLWPVAT
jgi:hypothetical protein